MSSSFARHFCLSIYIDYHFIAKYNNLRNNVIGEGIGVIMNWFKRYGIVGAYFLFFVTLWFKSISSFSLIEGQQQLFAAVFTFTFLPVGYCISIISQWLYYKELSGHCIHKKFIKNDLDDVIRTKYNLESKYSEEDKAEIILTCRIRLDETNNLDRIKYLAGQATKRFDVVAINKAIILSTALSPFGALFSSLFICNFNIKLTPYYGRLSIVVLISVVIIILLTACNSIMYRQINILDKEILSKEWKKQEETTSKNN